MYMYMYMYVSVYDCVCLSVCLSVRSFRSAVCLSISTAVCGHLIRFWLCRCGDVIELINTGSPDWWKVREGEGGKEKGTVFLKLL